MNEINLSDKSNRELYRKIGTTIESLGGNIVSDLGYEQLSHPLDQIYIDYEWMGKIVTLHLEHFLGISLLSDEITNGELKKLSDTILEIVG